MSFEKQEQPFLNKTKAFIPPAETKNGPSVQCNLFSYCSEDGKIADYSPNCGVAILCSVNNVV